MSFLKGAVSALLLALIPTYAIAASWQALKPGGQTVLISATTTAATVTLPGAGGSLLVYNSCTVVARVDTTGKTATTPVAGTTPGSLGIQPSTLAVIEIGTFATSVSVKLDSAGPCNVEMTRGEGMAH